MVDRGIGESSITNWLACDAQRETHGCDLLATLPSKFEPQQCRWIAWAWLLDADAHDYLHSCGVMPPFTFFRLFQLFHGHTYPPCFGSCVSFGEYHDVWRILWELNVPRQCFFLRSESATFQDSPGRWHPYNTLLQLRMMLLLRLLITCLA